MDQVAEFAWVNLHAYQFAWVLSHLGGVYNGAKLLLELNGPGESVFAEMRNLRLMINNGSFHEVDPAEQDAFQRVVGTVRNYIYSRIDNMAGGGGAWHWKTNQQNKATIYTQLKDGFTLGQIRIKSLECLDEMKHIVQTGLEIRGEGSAKDDRPMALALATRAWIDSERPTLIGMKRTRETEAARQRGFTPSELQSFFMQNIMTAFLERQAATRVKNKRVEKRQRWGR
jgi:hypothetical protein